jgi:hypothetical protein
MTNINLYYTVISHGGSYRYNNKTEKYIRYIYIYISELCYYALLYIIHRGISSIGRVTVLHTVG